LSVCLPNASMTQNDLEQEFTNTGRIAKRIGECTSCNAVGPGMAANMGYPSGDAACQIWQDVANNGDPNSTDFSLAKKLQTNIILDTRILNGDNRVDRMYYCGYREAYKTCIYVPVICHDVHTCGDYEKMVMNYCE